MLIDASHPEETRVVVLDGQRVEEFDFEAATRLPLKGNIYLAKITRVEPSLQAAFVEYGGNRQGFLAFSEIHPDYYQIPVADRQALLAEQEAEARRQAEEEDAEDEAAALAASGGRDAADADVSTAEIAGSTEDGAEGQSPIAEIEEAAASESDSDIQTLEGGDAIAVLPAADGEQAGDEDDDYFPPADRHEDDDHVSFVASDDHEDDDDHPDAPVTSAEADEEVAEGIVDEQAAANAHFTPVTSDDPDIESESVHEGLGEDTEGESGGAVDVAEEIAEGIVDEQAAASAPAGRSQRGRSRSQSLQNKKPSQRFARRRHYKIQEVIKRRQIILVQVVKEERGNKGAALTTYLSLAGRYCVLMPNTPRGGGISRKITSASDRKRLKGAVQSLELQEGMGLIIRTAGENRTKVELKRDYEYLLRMWDSIRELTLRSNAPACVYEEGDLIKRAIRDLYNKDVSEIIVEGEDGYKNAKDFMRMLMPSHAKNVKLYKEPVPLYQRQHIEAQLDAMFSQTVHLKSGGYIVINQTEALVAIDVNSGRATREHSIEETAHKTNLEAADEVARQLRLRDLAGLIVIDFIDMEDHRNDRNVEKRLYNAVKNDRARIQVGKISQFGLLEMSRQRLRAGVIAGSTIPCPHCAGQGIVRSVESTALRVLRAIEDEAQKLKASAVTVKVPADVAIYTLNQKRRELARIETDYGMLVTFEPDDKVHAGEFEIIRTSARNPDDKPRIAMMDQPITVTSPGDVEEDEVEAEDEEEVEADEIEEDGEEEVVVAKEQSRPPREGGQRRERNRQGGGGGNDGGGQHQQRASEGHDQGAEGEGGRKRRRRRRGRRGRKDGQTPGVEAGGLQTDAVGSEHTEAEAPSVDGGDPMPAIEPNTSSSPSWSLSPEVADAASDAEPAAFEAAQAESPTVAEPVATSAPVEPESVPVVGETIAETIVTDTAASSEPPAEPRKGWWQRTFKRPE
jgi:ribonuclease E